MNSTWVSQHCVLKVLLLIWSSPAALEKVKFSASSILNVPKSLFTHAAYHLCMISSFVEIGPSNPLALANRGKLTIPVSAQAPAPSRYLRDATILAILDSP
jgi:hypothetical protein